MAGGMIVDIDAWPRPGVDRPLHFSIKLRVDESRSDKQKRIRYFVIIGKSRACKRLCNGSLAAAAWDEVLQ